MYIFSNIYTTYLLPKMAKNKGLTPKRKKIDRNPRVKHREKFRRAKIRRKGQVRVRHKLLKVCDVIGCLILKMRWCAHLFQVLEVRREETRYSGEFSGIRAGIKKSIKLK